MKKLLPLLLMLSVVLACAVPQNTSRTGPQQPQPRRESPTMQYTKLQREAGNDVYYVFHYQVKNTSSRPLEFVKANASFYDKDGNFLRGAEMYIDKWHSLAPGERSNAVMQTDPDRRIRKMEIEFSCKDEDGMGDVTIAASQVDKIS